MTRDSPSPPPTLPRTAHPSRVPSLDALRGLAVLFMLEVHLGYWWARETPPGDPLVVLGTVLGGAAAPLFFTLAGAGIALSARGRPREALERALRRGALLLCAGLVFTFVEQRVYGPWGWGALQSIGLSIIICAPLLRLRPGARALLALAILAATPVLRRWAGVPEALYSGDMMAVSTPVEYVRSMLLAGFFPLFPWVALVMMGSAGGDWLFARRWGAPCGGGGPMRGHWGSGEGRGAARLRALGTSLALTTAGGSLALLGDPVEFFPLSPALSLIATGVALLSLSAAALLGQSGPWPRAPTCPGPLASLGRLSLTIFVLHHIIGFEAFRALSLLHSMPLHVALVSVLLSWALTAALARLWSRADFRWSLERLIRGLAG